jgi:LysR family transcriptional regulator, transcriptional activator of the cysJI operon
LILWGRAHRAELGVVGGFVTAPEVRAEPLVEDEIVVVGPRSLAGRRLSRAELGAMTWISREEGSATRALVEATCTNLGIAPSRRLILPSWEGYQAGGQTRRRHRGMQPVRHRG